MEPSLPLLANSDRSRSAPGVAVVVLTGGASSRMGEHKPALPVGGVPMVVRVLAAAAPRPTVVVGAADSVPPTTDVVADEPPGRGPVAGLAAGVAALVDAIAWSDAAEPVRRPPVVVVLAADLPFVTSAHVDRLVAAVVADSAASVAVTVPTAGQGAPAPRPNWLCAAWRLDALMERLADLGDPTGRSMRALVANTRVVHVDDPAGVAEDVDTRADLDRARTRADRQEPTH